MKNILLDLVLLVDITFWLEDAIVDVLEMTGDVEITDGEDIIDGVVTVGFVSDELITEDDGISEDEIKAEMNDDEDNNSVELDIEAIEGRNAGHHVRG